MVHTFILHSPFYPNGSVQRLCPPRYIDAEAGTRAAVFQEQTAPGARQRINKAPSAEKEEWQQ